MALQKQLYFMFWSLILGGTLLLSPNAAKAQQDFSASSPEDIAIAFYKTGKTIPNFKHWIEKTAPYNTTPKARRPDVMKQELRRLQTAYNNFAADEDHLIIKTNAYLVPGIEKDSSGQNTYKLNIVFDKDTDVFYFPYEFMGQRIMVMPEQFHDLKSVLITERDYNRLLATTREKQKTPFILRLKATEADLTGPHNIHGMAQWAFMGEVVSMESWNFNGALLWEYTAPWYVSPKTQKMNKLYDSREDDMLYLRDVKSLEKK